MEKAFNFVKSHPVAFGLLAVGIIALVFWPSGGGGDDGGAAANAAAAQAVATTSAANAQLVLSRDQVNIAGLTTAAATAMNAANNAAAVSIAGIEAGTAKASIDAELAAQQSDNAKAITLGEQVARSQALQAIGALIPKTQAQSLAKGQQTDAAGFGLMEMFKNFLNAGKGIAATQTLITSTGSGTTATVYDSDGKAGDTIYTATRQDGGFYRGTAGVGGQSIVKGTATGISKNGKKV